MSCLIGVRLLDTVPSSWCGVGAPCRASTSDCPLPRTSLSLHPSQSVSLAASPSFPRDGFLHACLYYVMVSCLALIGRSPTFCTRLPTYTFSTYYGPASDRHGAWWSKGADPRMFRARSLRNILHDVIHSLHTGRYRQTLRRNIQTIWRLLSCVGYLTINTFWCSYLLLP